MRGKNELSNHGAAFSEHVVASENSDVTTGCYKLFLIRLDNTPSIGVLETVGVECCIEVCWFSDIGNHLIVELKVPDSPGFIGSTLV
jgi:hypothetical protein